MMNIIDNNDDNDDGFAADAGADQEKKDENSNYGDEKEDNDKRMDDEDGNDGEWGSGMNHAHDVDCDPAAVDDC